MKKKNRVVDIWKKQTDAEQINAIRALLTLGVSSIQADEGSLLIYDHTKHELVFTEVVGSDPKDIIGKSVQLGDGVTGNAALLQEIQIGSRLVDDQMLDVEGDGHPFSVLAIPILIADELWGCITAVRFSEGATFSSQDGAEYLRYASILTCIVSMRQQLDFSMGKITESELSPERCEDQRLLQKFSDFIVKHPEKKSAVMQLLNVLDGLCE